MSVKIDAFLKKNNFEVIDTVRQVEEIEEVYNIKFPDELEKLLSALIATKRRTYFFEWNFSAEDIMDYSSFKGKNLFEEMVKLDQQNYFGIRMLELFTNSIFFGSLGNGDTYFVNFNMLNENKERRAVEIVFFNHEIYDLEFVFADSLESFITVNELLDDIIDDDMIEDTIDTEAFTVEMGKLAGKVNLPWHFNELMNITMIEPEYKTVEQARYLMYRSLWVIHLLKSDDLINMGRIPEIFSLIKHPPINNIDEFIKLVSAQNPVSSIYWLWYFFFFNKEEYLQKFCEALEVIPSPMVQDAIKLVCELQNGRKELGIIKDIHKLREQFLKLDLDPDKEEQRKIS